MFIESQVVERTRRPVERPGCKGMFWQTLETINPSQGHRALMMPAFKNDFWSLARENKGYYSWARKQGRRCFRALHRGRGRGCPFCDGDADPIDMIQSLFEDGLGIHPLLDIAFEAFARAEARLGMRFIPQRSHEERLTGHLISELEAAIQMASESFKEEAVRRYLRPLHIDFVYYDLSRGGHLEKTTGGDFGLILVIDLPDRPKVIRYAAIQAKRLDGSTPIDKSQFDTLSENFQTAAAYLFYDWDFSTLAPPMVVSAGGMDGLRNSKDETKSFAVDQNFVFQHGLPLSLWLLTELGSANSGAEAQDFGEAMEKFTSANRQNNDHEFSRLAMLSIGRRFTVIPNKETRLKITL